jgi:hypothetical protein
MCAKVPFIGTGQDKAVRFRLPSVVPLAAEQAGRSIATVVVVAILAAAVAILLWHSVRANEGHFVLSLDDPYIHLSMARSLVNDGVWGVAPPAFSATSSAPLYTLLLAAAFLVGGVSQTWAWTFAIIGGLAVAAILAHCVSRHFHQTAVAVALGLWAVIIVGVPEMMFTGMEHTLHALAVLLIAMVAVAQSEKSEVSMRSDLLLGLLVLVGCGLRYETLFLVPALFGFLLWSGRRTAAMMAGIASVLPALILGLVQVANGQMVLPNTLMLKGVIGYSDTLSYLSRFLTQIESSYLTALLALVGVGTFLTLFHRGDSRPNPRILPATMFLSGCFLHATLAKVDRRYVGYLLALGIVAAVPYAAEWLEKAGALIRNLEGGTGRARPVWGWALIVCIGVLPFTDRLADLQRLPSLSGDVYAQQYQMAQFFASEYPGKRVGLNDIGTTSWLGENPVLDLWGLADGGVARARVRGQWKTEKMRQYVAAMGTEIIAVYPSWYSGMGGLPREWVAVGSWDLMSGVQVSVAQPQVVFFATNYEAADLLKIHLKNFAPNLPPGVAFTPYY